VSELAPLVAPLNGSPPSPGTGSLLRDAMRSGLPAPELVVVPNGQFRAGTSSTRADFLDAIVGFSARLAGGLAVARTETAVAEFRRFVEDTGYQPGQGCWYHSVEQEWKLDQKGSWSEPVFAQGDDHPVTCVTFEDAQAYAAWMSRETGRAYRLPTEAEFEFFNRGGRAGDSVIGAAASTGLCAAANGADRTTGLSYAIPCVDGFAATAPVGRFEPNDFGLYDTTGNLWELTLDCWQSAYVRALWNLVPRRRSGSDQDAGACPARHVVRGGAFLSSALNLRFDHRELEGYRSSRVGFRVVRELQ
jgi:formylglycine-generating enzyme required for sulfatase activity